MRKLTLFFAFLLSVMGVTQTWAQISDDFSGYTTTTSGKTLGDNWVIIGSNSNAVFGTSSCAYTHYNEYDEHYVAALTNFNHTNGTWLVLKKQVTGTVTYTVTNGATTPCNIYVSKATESGSSFEITGTESTNSVPARQSSEKTYTFDAGSDPTYIAFCLDSYSKYLKLRSVTYTEYVDAGAIAKPTAFSISSTTYESATFSWTAGGEETAWELVYGVSGFDKEQATPISITENPYTLTGLTENTTYDAYLRAKSGDDVSSWTSKVTFTTPAQYPAPTGFTAGAFTATTQTFSWTNGSTETAWQIKYSTDADFDPESAGTLQAVTTNPYTLEGLTAETTYYAYLRADYGTGYSAWCEKVSFTPSATITMTIFDETYTSNYVPVYGLYSDYGTNSQFIIPNDDLSGISGRQITKIAFYSSSNWSDSPKYEIYMLEVDNATFTSAAFVDWSTMTKVKNETTLTSNNKILEIELDDAFDYNGSNLLVGFKETGYGSGNGVSWYGKNMSTGQYTAAYNSANSSHVFGNVNRTNFLPKMTITSVPGAAVAVKKPKNLEALSVIASAATLAWTDGEDGLSAWQIALGTTENFDPDAVTPIEANANPFTVAGLTAETTYYAYVRAKKGSDVSDWSNKVSFTTPNTKPSDVAVAAADNSATFSWTANAGESAWQIKYSTNASFDPDSEGTLQAVTTNPYTLTGLVPEITYYAYLRADLGGGNYSDWTAKQTFTTGFDHELTVNDGTDNNSYVPFYGSYTDAANRGESQFIIPATQIASMNGATINQLTFYLQSAITSWNSGSAPTFEVYLQEVNYTAFANHSFVDWGTRVWEGQITFSGTQMIINLDNPYTYNGGNLLIGFKEPAGAGYNTSIKWLGVNTTSNTAVNNQSGSTTYSFANFLPKTTFNYETVTGPRLAVSTDALDFGEITLSSTAEDMQKTFNISNTGAQELTGLSVVCAGVGYSVSALPRTNITTTGENSSDIEMTVTFAPTTSGIYEGSVTVSATGQPDKVINLTATYVADPIMGVFNDDQATEAATTGQTIDFGYAQEVPSYTYYIKNTGAGTLDVDVTDGGLTVSPANVSLASGEQQAFIITANVANPDATVTFTGTNHDSGASVGTFAVTLQGTVMSLTGTFFEGFNYATGDATPDASTTELPGWEINNNTYNVKFYQGNIYYWAQGSEAGSVVTTKVYVAGTNDVLRVNAYARNLSYNNTKLAISYSADKNNWTELSNKGKSDFTTANVLQEFTFSGIPEGNYYIKIEMSDVAVDYIYGFSSTLATLALNQDDQTEPNVITTGMKDITLNYVFSKASGRNYNTIAVPFEITDLSIFGEGVKAYTLKSYDETSGNITFTEVESLEAGKPYMLHADTPTTETSFAFYNVDVTDVEEGETSIEGVTFHANYSYKNAGDITGEWYGVNSTTGSVQKAGPTTHLLAFRGYFTFDTTPAKLNVTFVDNSGDATTINAAEILNNQDGNIYDLSGRKVSKVQKGIYIQNGKKVVIK